MPDDININQRQEEPENNNQEPRAAFEGDLLGEIEPMPPRGDIAWLGIDGTAAPALIQVGNAEPEDEYLDPELKDEFADPTTIDLSTAPGKLHTALKGMNLRQSIERGRHAKAFINFGKMLINTKEKVLDSRQKWAVWKKENLEPIIDKRILQQAEQIAAVTNIEDFWYLGKERLLKLVRATSQRNEADRIARFLSKYRIQFNPETDQQQREYKKEVDNALKLDKFYDDLAKERLYNIEVPFELFKRLLATNCKPDAKLIQEVKLALENGQTVSDYLESLIQGTGAYDDAAKSVTKAESYKDGVKGLQKRTKWMSRNFVKVKDSIDDQLLADLDSLKANLVELIELKKAQEQTEAA
jgi:hypothetical protein